MNRTRGEEQFNDGLFQTAALLRAVAELHHQALQFCQLLVKARPAIGWHVVGGNCSVAAPLGDDRFGGVVCCVRIHVGQVTEQCVAPRQAGVAQRCTREPEASNAVDQMRWIILTPLRTSFARSSISGDMATMLQVVEIGNACSCGM